jgi:deoxycytidine triphosphate deaminase
MTKKLFWPSLRFPAINLLSAPIQNKNGLLSYNELCELVEQGVINAPMEHINSTSIDITLHHIIRRESIGSTMSRVRLLNGESISTEEIDMSKSGPHTMMPDSVILAANNERLNLPLDITAQYVMKSSMGRNFLSHQFSGFIDPGFHGVITLELKNESQFHKLVLEPGLKIGQIYFFRHEPVPAEHSYAAKGRYNGHDKVAPSKGVL